MVVKSHEFLNRAGRFGRGILALETLETELEWCLYRVEQELELITTDREDGEDVGRNGRILTHI